MTALFDRGWVKVPAQSDILAWATSARQAADHIANDPVQKDLWLRHGKTWFAGVNALPNQADGRLDNAEFPQSLHRFLSAHFSWTAWDQGQLSIIYPGYPKQDVNETDGAHRFRKIRDAAHVDGLTRHGPDARRYLTEFHAFVLGIPLTDTSQDASPLVVWDGSHKIMRDIFVQEFSDVDVAHISDRDVTDVYQAARKYCFENCKRVIVHAQVGAAYVVHRHALHGVAPWGDTAQSPSQGRMIAYFRPEFSNGAQDWLNAP